MGRKAWGHGAKGTGPLQNFAVTYSNQGEGADCVHHILMSPPSFENHRRACMPKIYNVRKKFYGFTFLLTKLTI